MYSVQCTLYSALCTLFGSQCAVYTAHSAHKKSLWLRASADKSRRPWPTNQRPSWGGRGYVRRKAANFIKTPKEHYNFMDQKYITTMLCWWGRVKGFRKGSKPSQQQTNYYWVKHFISEDYFGHIHNTQLVAWVKLKYFQTAIDCVGPTMVVHQIKVTDD